MDSTLSDLEISLLKELKGAGERRRILPRAQSVLTRLLRVGYVKRKASADRYVITDIGTAALSDAIA
jgi:hypothetical protein